MFEVREIESDISFIRNYLTKESGKTEKIFTYLKKRIGISKSQIKSMKMLEINLFLCA